MFFPWWQAVILGGVQGLTEFLPVSSSGHLALIERWFGLGDLPLTFDVMLHLGTLVSLVVFFWKDIWRAHWQYWLRVGVATIPAVAFGLLLKPYLKELSSPAILSLCFLITALFVWMADELLKQESQDMIGASLGAVLRWRERLSAVFNRGQSRPEVPTYLQSFLIGLMQSFALLPSVSRSGSTLLGSLLVGLEREAAFRFTFLIGIPAIAGAIALDAVDVLTSGTIHELPWMQITLGTLTSMVTGFLALSLLRLLISRWNLRFFAAYCVFVSFLSYFFA